jgi:hypothetical protein
MTSTATIVEIFCALVVVFVFAFLLKCQSHGIKHSNSKIIDIVDKV